MNKLVPFLSRIALFSILALGSTSWAMKAPVKSLKDYHFGAASVLPVTYFEKKGQGKVKYVILGREAAGADKGTYDDFGGSRDKGEGHPVITAAREFHEEAIIPATLGWNLKETQKFIDLNSGNTEYILASNNSGTYITKFSNADIVSFKKKFHGALKQQKSFKCKEKDRIATVRWDLLKKAIVESKYNTGVKVEARLVDPKTGKDEGGKTTITLRPFLAKRLRPLFEKCPYDKGNNSKIRFY